jgi:TolB protein
MAFLLTAFRALRRAALILLAVTAGATAARADVHIDVTRGTSEPLPIALSPLAGAGARETQVGRDIAGVVSADLEHSGLFRPLDPRAFVQDPASLNNPGPRFDDWRVLNAQALMSGSVDPTADGRLRVEFRLWDVGLQQQLTGFAYQAPAEGWRRIAHQIADAIYKRLTGEDGYFDTRIVYIAETGPANARKKMLAIMDQDGENNKFLTDGRQLVLTPRFSPTAQEITYLSYYNNNKPRVYLFNIDPGRQEVLGDFPGMTFAPRFSPDGNRVIMSMAQNGVTNLYTMDLRTRKVSQLTGSQAIDTSASYSPDGSQIVFESDRGGSQQLYVMNADGGGEHRISGGGGSYGRKPGTAQFQIGVMHPDGTGERILESAYHVEGPTWAPNGRVLVFFKERPAGASRVAKLYTIDVTGANERELITPLDASDPAWSPLIP